MQPEFNAKAQSRQAAIGFFYYETRKPRIIGKISWFPGFVMELFLVAPLRFCVFALSVFCKVADCKVWPSAWWLAARSGRPQGPGQKTNGHRKAGPGPDWPALPELGAGYGETIR
jgi:hypothetical protein